MFVDIHLISAEIGNKFKIIVSNSERKFLIPFFLLNFLEIFCFQLSLLIHPDKNADDRDRSERAFDSLFYFNDLLFV